MLPTQKLRITSGDQRYIAENPYTFRRVNFVLYDELKDVFYCTDKWRSGSSLSSYIGLVSGRSEVEDAKRDLTLRVLKLQKIFFFFFSEFIGCIWLSVPYCNVQLHRK